MSFSAQKHWNKKKNAAGSSSSQGGALWGVFSPGTVATIAPQKLAPMTWTNQLTWPSVVIYSAACEPAMTSQVLQWLSFSNCAHDCHCESRPERKRKCADNYTKWHNKFIFFKTAISISVISNHISIRVLLKNSFHIFYCKNTFIF